MRNMNIALITSTTVEMRIRGICIERYSAFHDLRTRVIRLVDNTRSYTEIRKRQITSRADLTRFCDVSNYERGIYRASESRLPH